MLGILVVFIIVGLAVGNDFGNEMDICDRNDDKQLSHDEFECVFMHWDKNHDRTVNKEEWMQGWHSDGLSNNEHASAFYIEMDIDNSWDITSNDMDHMFAYFDTDRSGKVSEGELKTAWDAFVKDRFGSDD